MGVKRKVGFNTLFISVLLAVGVLAVVLTLTLAKGGTRVVVMKDAEVIAEYSLQEDGTYPIGDGNVLVIEDGCAYMSYADCPDKTCMHRGKISAVGESITCLPNRVTVYVTDGTDQGDLVS